MIRPSSFLALLLTALLSACQPAPEQAEQTTTSSTTNAPLRVTATTNVVADLARSIGGDQVVVTGLMGAGVDPHLYKASAGDVRRLQDADLILYGGLHLEGKMIELLEKNDRAVAVTKDMKPTELLFPDGAEQMADPHVWFDVSLWKQAAQTTRDALIDRDPKHSQNYTQRAEDYLKQLDQLDREVSTLIKSIPPEKRVMITAHDAFHYFGRRYGLEVRGIQGISTAAEAGTQSIQDLARLVSSRKIPAIFVESSVPQRTVDAVIAAAAAQGHTLKLGGELYSDALGDEGTPEGTYIGMMKHNAKVITQALGGSVGSQP